MSQLRIVDLMCDWHKALISRTRVFPIGYAPGNDPDGNNSCHGCAWVGRTQPSGRWWPPPAPLDDSPEPAAIHEAGHIVANLLYGVPIIRASLTPGNHPASNAFVEVTYLPGQQGGMAEIVGLWAGQAATLHWLKVIGADTEATRIDAIFWSGDDCRKVFASGLERDVRLAARDAADSLILEHWAAVESVAAALLDAVTLDGEALARIAGITHAGALIAP